MPVVETERALWAVVLAAGRGARLAGEVPKQYRTVAGRRVLEHAVAPFLAMKSLSGIMVVLSADDSHFASLPLAQHPLVHHCIGASERAGSSLAGVRAVIAHPAGGAAAEVMVHDAARALVAREDIETLLERFHVRSDSVDKPIGAILARPLGDTLKRAEHMDDVVCTTSTVSREGLWVAETPQLFAAAVLADALEQAGANSRAITDEASALEAAGHKVLLVEAQQPNFKITRSSDLMLAEAVLRHRGQEHV